MQTSVTRVGPDTIRANGPTTTRQDQQVQQEPPPHILTRMTDHITRINPDTLHATPGYHHITVVEAGRTAHLAGQCPLDLAGRLVGPGDVLAQADQVAVNALAALAAVNAGPEQVVRTVIYVVTTDPDVLGEVSKRLRASPLAPAFSAASTLLGVAQLGYPGQLVEIDLYAALYD